MNTPSVSPEPVPARTRISVLILVAEGDRALEGTARLNLTDLQSVTISRGPERRFERGASGRLDLKLPDERMSAPHVQLVRSPIGWQLEDLGSKNGTQINGAGQSRAQLVSGDLLQLGHCLFRFQELTVGALPVPEVSTEIDGTVETFQPLLHEAATRVGASGATASAVLICGEVGVGKAALAEALHFRWREDAPFLVVDCGVVPPEALELQLFGCDAGAVPGVTRGHAGWLAAGGTVYLEGLESIREPTQRALARVLSSGTFLRVGSRVPRRSEVKLIIGARSAAAESPLAAAIGLRLDLPPFRTRPEDFGFLLRNALRRVAGENARSVRFSGEALRRLAQHPWPANALELEGALRAALAGAGGDRIRGAHLPFPVNGDLARPAPSRRARVSGDRVQLEALLAQHGGNISAVARALGKSRMQIHRWIKHFGIPRTL